MPRLPVNFFTEADSLLDLFESPSNPDLSASTGGPATDSQRSDGQNPGVADPESLPPVVYCSKDARSPDAAWGPALAPGPIVVWGWPILRSLGKAAGAWVYAEERPLKPAQALRLALALEGRPGGYSWREMDRIVAFCERCAVEVDSEISRAVTGDGRLVHRVERYRSLPGLLRRALDDGETDMKTAEGLESLAAGATASGGSASREVLEGLLAAGRTLSHSNRRKLLSLGRELLLSRRLEPLDILRSLEAKNGTPRPAEELLRELRRHRYPELTSMTDQLEGFAAKHLKGSGVRLAAPPNFEGRRFSVSFDFADSREFSGRLAALKRAGENLEDILDLL